LVCNILFYCDCYNSSFIGTRCYGWKGNAKAQRVEGAWGALKGNWETSDALLAEIQLISINANERITKGRSISRIPQRKRLSWHCYLKDDRWRQKNDGAYQIETGTS